MDEKLPCGIHTEQIKTLFKRVDSMEKFADSIHSLDKNYALQTQLLENVVNHNEKQDKMMAEQHDVISKINTNLTELNEGQRTLNNRVGKLEEKVEENEDKSSIDIRDITKERSVNMLKKWAAPASIGMAIGMIILEIIKILK